MHYRANALTVPGNGDDCPLGGCGTNGIWLGENIRFHEIDAKSGLTLKESILFNAKRGQLLFNRGDQQLKIEGKERLPDTLAKDGVGALAFKGFRLADGTVLTLVVRADELVGKVGATEYTRGQLTGAVITLTDKGPTPVDYELKIKNVDSSHFWTVKTGRDVPLYSFEFKKSTEPNGTPCQVCDDNIDVDAAFKGKVVIFEGDRYDHDYAIDEVGGRTTKFNIACAGTAISKLHLLRHTWAGEQHNPHVNTTISQRETLFRLIAADYCGTGRPFTVDGHPLKYTFDQQWQPQYPTFELKNDDTLEAIWGPGGAICLDRPRLVDQVDETQLRDLIATVCGRTLPKCTTDSGALTPAAIRQLVNLKEGYAVSVNPAPPPGVAPLRCAVPAVQGSIAPTGSNTGPTGGSGSGSGTGGLLPPCPWNEKPKILCP